MSSACEVAGIDARTLQRWKATTGLSDGDGRPRAVRPLPAHALSSQEREQILKLANEARFAELPPARIVPMLADEGTYIASESSFSRVLRAHGQRDIGDVRKRLSANGHRVRISLQRLGRCGVGI